MVRKLPSSALHAPFESTFPVPSIHDFPEHLQVDALSPASKTGGDALFKQVATTLPPVHTGFSPHKQVPVASSVEHVFPV